MNSNISQLATLAKKRATEVDTYWKTAKKHISAESQTNYVLAFKLMLKLLDWKQTPQAFIPEKVGDVFRFMGTPAVLESVDSPHLFQLKLRGSETLLLPLINLIFCTSKAPSH